MRKCYLYITQLSDSSIDLLIKNSETVTLFSSCRPPGFHHNIDTARFLSGRLLLLTALRQLGYPSSLIKNLKYGQYRKPFINGVPGFNIAHSGKYIILALAAQGSIGVDIEKIETVDLKIYQRFFSHTDWKKMQNAPSPVDTFYNFWTKKEALLKAAGTGLIDDPASLSVHSDPVFYENKFWHFTSCLIESGYSAHIAMEYKNPIVQKYLLTPEQLLNNVSETAGAERESV